MVPSRIKFTNPPYHISEFLTHWTGRDKKDVEAFNILSKIIETKQLKFSQNTITPALSKATVKNQMICFTDTPIIQSLKHCEKYNQFGISFNKESLIDYGANPVLYIVSTRYAHQEFLTDQSFQGLFELNKEKVLFSWMNSILQPFDNGFSDSYEREWRIVRLLPFPWLDNEIKRGGPFHEYPFKGEITRVFVEKPIPKEDFYLNFEPKIIENIVVPEHFEKEAIELIKKNNLTCELILIENS